MALDAKMGDLVKNTIAQVEELFPYIGTYGTRSLKLKKIWAEEGLDPNDIKSQLIAKHNGQTWGIPIKAEIELHDSTLGKAVAKPSTITLMKLPMMTSRQSFIVDGGEYQVDHLLKLKSGVYTRAKRDGGLVSEFMMSKGGNKNFELMLDRKKSIINFKSKKSDAKIPAYPLMKVMGVSDDDLEKQWGKQVFEANKITNPEAEARALRTFYAKTGGKDLGHPPTTEELKQHVYAHFDQTELHPDTTKATLGQSFVKVTGPALLAASAKLLKLERKEVEPDDRDSLIFKDVVHVEDFIPEKLNKSKNLIRGKIRQSIGYKNSVSEILQGGELFRRPVTDFFLKGGNVAERSEQTNPAQMLAGNFKTTLVAKDYGGIKDAEKLGDEMRAINPSHFGFLDPMHTPESERTGITLHLGSMVFKEGKKLKTKVYDLKAGKSVDIDVPDFHGSAVVLADQVKWEHGKPIPYAKQVKVKLPGGDIGHMPMHEARYVMPTAKSMFSHISNLIPFLQNDQGNRASMADKQIEQAISLKTREAPLVQSSIHEGRPEQTFEKAIGNTFASHRAPVAGKVTKITQDAIHVHDGKNTHEIQIYNNFPLNDPTAMMHSEPIVKVGDMVKPNQVLADSNFTRNGVLSLGTNLRIGYLPYKGYNFEDGIVISESAAQKLTSDHLHKLRLDIDPTVDKTSKNTWKAHSSRKASNLTKEQWAALDEHGVVREGAIVLPGQVLATCLAPTVQKSEVMQKAFGTRASRLWRDKSLVWDSDHVGTVARVVKAPNGKDVQVFVRTAESAEIGDKLSGRHGNKGIITKILPDKDMPFTKNGDLERPIEVLLNPSGVPTRMNVGQVLETAAGKIAEKTGTPYFVNNFAGPHHDYLKQVQDDLKKHGLHDEELVYDPKDVRRPLGSVLVGPQHILKLKHQVEKKLVVRGGESDLDGQPYGYDLDRQPYRGGAHGGQGFGALELYALLGHNARNNLREMATYKSDQQSPDFWRLIQEGREPGTPKIPFSFQKFEGLLKGMGVDVRKDGTSLRLVPMTDKEVLKLAGDGKNEIKKPALLTSKGMKPEKGGFFDPAITGVNGDKWSFLRLVEPMPNPIFVGETQHKGPIPSLLSLHHGPISVPDIDAIMEGRKTLDGKVGGAAIYDALKKVDVDTEIKNLRTSLTTKRGSKKDHIHRTLKYLLALKDLDLKPHEAYVLQNLPIMPPAFRPITPTATGDIAKSSLNDLYRNIGVTNERLGVMDPAKFGHGIGTELRGDLWNGFKALQAVGNFKPAYDKDSHEERKLKGILQIIGGDSEEGIQPKEGYFQSRLVKRKQDLSIRSTIVPEPSLHIDEVGLPLRAAMELYKPFVVGRLHSRYSYHPDEALKEMQKFSDRSKAALQEVMDDRPLILKRDPVLHKFGVMAFRPKIMDGKAIKIHPLVTGGYNADFDGDSVDLDTPIYLRIRGNATMKTGRQLECLLNVPDGDWVSETKDIEAWTYNGWKPVKNFSFHDVSNKKKYRVTLKNGIGFIVSEDHSLMVGRKKVKPTALSVGVELDHANVDSVSAYEVMVEGYERGVAYGNFLGDGSAEVRPQGGGRISIACKPELERAYLRGIWEKSWDVHTTDSEHGYFQVSNVDMAKHFLFVCGRYCDGKYVGDALLANNKEFLKGLLAGYILSDGSVELTKSGSFLIRTWSRSKALRDGMSFVANMLGLPHSLRERVAKGETNYIISFGKEAIKLIDYRCPGKKGDLIKLARSEYENNRNDDRRSLGERGFEVQSIEEVEYDDRMVDVEVDDESHVFTIHGGVVLHNTMAGTVPVSREAVEEAKKMFPTANLFSSTNYRPMHVPGQEFLLGLNIATKWGRDTGKTYATIAEAKNAHANHELGLTDVIRLKGAPRSTTVGRLLIAEHLPHGFEKNQDILHEKSYVIDKDKLEDIVGIIAKKHAGEFNHAVNHLKDVGTDQSFKTGFSIGLKDFEPLPERDHIIAKAQKEADHINKTVKDHTVRDNKLIDIWGKATSELDAASKARFANSGNRLAQMVYSKARGKTEQLRQMIAAPVLMQDATGKVVTTPVTRSYGEGLDLGDYWLSQHGARKGTLQRAAGTREPGAMTKDIINSTISTLITSPDCKTPHGISMSLDPSNPYHDDIYDRYLAKEHGPFKAGALVTPDVVTRLRQVLGKNSNIQVRSPLKCQHGTGICAKCFGLNENSKLHPDGTNIGIIAGQALGEPAMQLAMDAFHTGGLASGRGGSSVSRIERLKQLLKMPDTLKGSAILAKSTGVIQSITPNAGLGGHDVLIDGAVHHVRAGELSPTLKAGQAIRRGQTLSNEYAPIHPKELLQATKDMHEVQRYLVDELYSKLYKSEKVRPRNIELAVRSLTNFTRVKDPGSSHWEIGDVVPHSIIEEHNREQKGQKNFSPVVHDPFIEGSGQIPHRSENWMARLNYQRLGSTLQRGAAQAWKSELHSTHPIPGIAYGAEFGKPPKTKKPYVY